MVLTTEILHTIEQVSPAEWDVLTQGQAFGGWQWLRATEALLLDYQPRYVLLRREGQLRAAAVCSLQKHFHSRLMQTTMGWFLARFPSMRCDVPISYTPGLFLSAQESLDSLFPALLQAVETLLKKERILFYSYDHLAPGGASWAYLQAHDYHRIDHVLAAMLEVRWHSFEEYLASLPAAEKEKYLQGQSQLAQQGITVRLVDPQVEDLSGWQELIHHSIYRYMRRRLYCDDVLLQASKLLGTDFKFVVAHQNGKGIGCLALLCSGEEWLGRWLAVDDEHLTDNEVYYGMVAEGIRQGILAGARRLDLGGLDYVSRQRFGLSGEKRVGAIAVRNRLFHWVAGKIRGLTANRYAEPPQNH